MSNKVMNSLAGIVLFHPDMDRLRQNIEAIVDQVHEIVLINNGCENLEAVDDIIGEYTNIALINNAGNIGVAAALKQIMEYAIIHGYDWVLTLDQDSVCFPGLMEAYSRWTDIPDAGIFTCNIIDRNFTVDPCFGEGECIKEITQCITSGSLIRVSAYQETDGFDEQMFIDSVDFDICINMRRHGYKIIRANYNGVLHEVGHGRNVKIIFKDYISYNHPASRQYYMARNHKYLVMKYPDEFNLLKEKIREIRSEVIILMYEDHKFEKLKSRWRGLRDARKMFGRVEDEVR